MSIANGRGIGIPFKKGINNNNRIPIFGEAITANRSKPFASTFPSSIGTGTRRTGQQGRSYLFDGTDDYVTVDNQDLNLKGDLTLALRFNPNASTYAQDEYLVCFAVNGETEATNIQYSIFFDATTNDLTYAHENGAGVNNIINSGYTCTAGTDYNLIVTRDVSTKTITFYINGVQVAQDTYTNDPTGGTSSTLQIGCLEPISQRVFDGKIWDVRIEDSIWTADNIAHYSSFGNIGTQGDALAWYKCDEQSGTTCYDSSGNGYDGTITNATLSTFHATQDIYSFQNNVGYNLSGGVYIPRDESATTNDVLGNPLTYTGKRPNDGALINSNCVTLNGTDQAVRVADNTDLDITDNLTVSVWAKNDNSGLGSTEALISKYDFGNNRREYAFYINVNEKLVVALGNPSDGTLQCNYESDSAITINELNHFVFTFKSGVLKLYLNGVEISGSLTSGSIPATLFNGSADPIIGAYLNNNAFAQEWDGQIFDARIYAGDSTVLTAEQIASIYSDPSANINFTGQTLAAHYKLAEGAGTTCFDASGNGNDGTIENAGSNWGTLQDSVHMNINTGFSLYEHASSDPIRVPYDASGSAITITPPSGYTKTSDNPRVNGLNDSETQVNFNPDSVPVNANIITTNDGDGSSYISVADNALFDITNYLSVSCWAKNDAALLSAAEYIIGKYNTTSNLREWVISIDIDEKLAINFGDPADGTFEGNFVSNDAVTLNQWNHYGFTFDSGTVKLYLNGVEVAGSTSSGTLPATLFNGTSPLNIFAGFAGASPSFFWNGGIQHCRIYKGDSTVLTEAQIAQVMNNSSKNLVFGGQTLITSHRLTGDTLDSSGNNLHGVNNGITFTKFTMPATYDFGDTIDSNGRNMFKREMSSVKEDRFVTYKAPLFGGEKTRVDNYTS